jgi:uncharacterized protein YkwD
MKKKSSNKPSQNPWGFLFVLFIFLSVVVLFITDSNNIFLSKMLGLTIAKPSITPFQEPSPTATDIPTPTSTPEPYIRKQVQANTQLQNNITKPTTTIPEGELINAINIYRQAHGLSSLNTNESLCQETRKRVQDMVNLNIGRSPGNFILNHDGMIIDNQNGTTNKLTGKTYFGENIAAAFCKRRSDDQVVYVETGTQLVEWCFDSSPSHKENLLRVDWTDVCSSGQFPFYVQTFAR